MSILEDITAERAYQEKSWGTAFDDRNTLNDWVAYAAIYLGRAASMKATPAEQREGILKTATILIAAVEAFDRNKGFPPRHYDPENPQMTVPADPSRSRAR
jgi:hypothetical protein